MRWSKPSAYCTGESSPWRIAAAASINDRVSRFIGGLEWERCELNQFRAHLFEIRAQFLGAGFPELFFSTCGEILKDLELSLHKI